MPGGVAGVVCLGSARSAQARAMRSFGSGPVAFSVWPRSTVAPAGDATVAPSSSGVSLVRVPMQIGDRSGDDSPVRVTSTAERALLNVVMPVFNERETVAEAIDAVLGVDLPGVVIRLVVVESNS